MFQAWFFGLVLSSEQDRVAQLLHQEYEGMSHWTLICIAAAANVFLNLSLRQIGRQINIASAEKFLLSLLSSPWTWLSIAGATVLVAAFVAAVRTYSLSLTYTAVTTLAIFALTVISVTLRYETISTLRVVGLVLIIVGLILCAQDDTTAGDVPSLPRGSPK